MSAGVKTAGIPVYLAGEGPHDLAVLVALLNRLSPDAFDVAPGRMARWSSLSKYRFAAGGHAAEVQSILKLQVLAAEQAAALVVFVRDSDGEAQRPADIRQGMAEAQEAAGRFPALPVVAGGCAVQELEAWLLALAGDKHTEEMSNPKDKAFHARYPASSSEHRAELVRVADFGKIPIDARSLRAWLDDVSAAIQTLGCDVVLRWPKAAKS